MKYKVKWGQEPNTANGICDIRGVLIHLHTCCYGNCSEWEEKMWENIHVGDWLERIVEMNEEETVYVPYQSDASMLPEVLMITAVKGE